MKLSTLAEKIENIKIIKDCDISVLGMATSKYDGKQVLSFLENEKYIESIFNNSDIVAIICTEKIYNKIKENMEYGILLSSNPKLSFFEIHNLLVDENFYWKEFDSVIHKSAVISKNAMIDHKNIIIGENTIIEPGVVIHPGVIIGDNCIIRSGTQLGTNGFQFINNRNKVFSVKTGGRTVIGNNVEIQHNCCVDRGILGGDTIIEDYVKVDNFVHIAHDNYIGERTLVTAGTQFAGRVIVGKDCFIGLNVTISNGINIGDNCKITLGAVVTKDVPSNSTVSGNFAIDHKRFIEFIKSIR